jgi:N-acetylglucosamine-6-phosphate deacetylase
MSYFDLQVNGYGGVDFNCDGLAPEELHRACERLESDGVGGILATIITEHVDAMCARIARITELRAQDDLATRIVSGIHIEGPFISPIDGYRGAHPADAVIPADEDVMKRLLDAAGGLVRLVTLAPECDERFRVTRTLADRGIVVSAGHTNASLDQLRGTIDAGLRMFTHLGNGCPMQMHRHDNIIQRALSLRDKLWLCFIADGVHVPLVALKNYLDLAGTDRSIIVTDAIAPAGLGAGRYTLGRWDLTIGDDLVARSPDGSHFIGSATTMRRAHALLSDQLGFSDMQCAALLKRNPRAAIGLSG